MLDTAMQEWERDELPWERRKRLAWKTIVHHRRDVARWLAANPSPNDWSGDALDWAYIEMPFPPSIREASYLGGAPQ